MIYVRTPVAPLIPSVDFPPPRARALVLASSTPPRDATAIPAPTAHAISATLARHPRDVDVLARDRSLTSVSPRSSSRIATPSTTPFAALRSQHPMLATPSTTPFAALRASKFERSPREMLCASLSLILASRGRAQCRLRTRVGLCRSVGHLSATELQLQLGYTYSYWGDSLVPHGSAFQTREPLFARDGKDADGELARDATPTEKKSDGRTETPLSIKVLSMVSYLFLQVAGTIFASLSRNSDDDYPYDTVVLAFTMESVKLVLSFIFLTTSRACGGVEEVTWSAKRFTSFALPALCYFVANNCMLLIIQELGPSTYQIMNNLKILSTGVLMWTLLGRRLTSLQWRALFLLLLGSVTAEITDSNQLRGSVYGYVLVVINTFIAAAGSVLSEKLLKGSNQDGATDSIHWQNMQLYFWGVICGAIPIVWKGEALKNGLFTGFNFYAWVSLVVLSFGGLAVSFILKYLDNIYKCFVSALSMLVVAIIHVCIEHETMPLRIIISIALVSLAMELYTTGAAT